MSKSITQDMAYRQSLMKYAEKYGVSRASRKYNKSRSYIYFWKQRWDGIVASLAAVLQTRSFACFSTLPSTSSRGCAFSPPTRSNLLTPQRILFAS